MGQSRSWMFGDAARRTAVVLVCLAYLLASIGFPLTSLSGKPTSDKVVLPVSACGCEQDAKRLRSCCCSRGHRGCCSESNAEPAEQPAIQWVVGVQQQECQGLATLWIVTGASLPPAPASVHLDLRPSGWVLSAPEHWINQPIPPASPPPRAATAGIESRPDATASAAARPCLNRRDIGV